MTTSKTLRLDDENASVVMWKDGKRRVNYLSHTDCEAMVEAGWTCRIVRDGGAMVKATIVAQAQRKGRAN